MSMSKIKIDLEQEIGTISRNIYGHFAEHIGGVIYDGLWVGEDSAVDNIRGFRRSILDDLKQIHAPVIRWPGGCFAEAYDWKDGIGPRGDRPVRLNWWHNEDARTETNEVGTHEMVDFCEIIGAAPYFAANVSTVSALEIRNWVEYCNFGGDTTLTRQRKENGAEQPFAIPYWGIGNENWGGGGNMTPDSYADHFRKYGQVAYNVDHSAKLIACGPNGNDHNWTDGFFKRVAGAEPPIWGYAAHFYCGTAGTAVCFDRNQWYQLIARSQKIENLIHEHWAIMGQYDPAHRTKLVLDEWGCWHAGGTGPSNGYNLFEQQSCMRDAVVAASTLNIFNNNCDKIAMANVAQVVNNLHSLFLANGSNCVRTPNFYVFDMYKTHHDAICVKSVIEADYIGFGGDEPGCIAQLSASASVHAGVLTLTVANTDYDNDANFALELLGANGGTIREKVVLCSDILNAVNDFDTPDRVVSCVSSEKIKVTNETTISIPKGGVLKLEIELA